MADATPPLDAERVLREFSGEVPVFPLPSLVLLPDTIAPLSIFEDRYRLMVADALEGERLIAMALLQPGWEPQYEGAPPIHERVCVGAIVNHERLADGRYKLQFTEPGPFTRDEPRQELDDAHRPVGGDGCDPGAARRGHCRPVRVADEGPSWRRA